MNTDIDKLFVEEIDDKGIIAILKKTANGLEYIANGIVNFEANLYISDDVEELESDELKELKEFSKHQLETVLRNLQRVMEKFFEVQRNKNGVGLYFNFYDGILCKTPVQYEKILDDESKQHPMMNRIFIISAYVLRFLLIHYFSSLDYLKRVIQYINHVLDEKKNNPMEIFALTIRMNQYKKEMEEMLEIVMDKIDSFRPFIKCFLDNIVSCIERSNEHDIEYLTKYPDQVYGIIQSISRLPKTDTIKVIMNDVLDKLYLYPILPNNVRFDIFSCIINSKENVRNVMTKLINRECPGILLDDAFELCQLGASGLNDHTSNLVGLISIVGLYMKAMKKNGSFDPIILYFTNNIEKTRSVVVGLFEYINKCVGEIYKEDSELTTEMSDELTAEVHLFLSVIKRFIKLNPNTINCHLVHYIPYVIINIWNSHRDQLDVVITTRMAKILQGCSHNNDFINYFSNLLTDNITHFERLIYFDSTKIKKRLDLFNKLTNQDTEFIDPIQSTFILKVGFLPMTGTDPMLCDKYVIESALRTNPMNPFTRQQMTIDDFNQIQIEFNDLIQSKEAERKRFVYQNKE